MKILVVDDDNLVLSSCRRVLEGEGFEVLLAGGVDEALKMIEGTNLQLLLIDIKMPVHDGLFLMKQVRERLLEIPIIVMSGYSTEETIRSAAEMGAANFIAKPFTPDELVKMVGSVLQKKES